MTVTIKRFVYTVNDLRKIGVLVRVDDDGLPVIRDCATVDDAARKTAQIACKQKFGPGSIEFVGDDRIKYIPENPA